MSEYITYEYYDECSEVTYTERREGIVRCRDCEHYANCMCFMPDGDGDFKRWEMMPDGFCSEGMRRR